MASYKEYHNAWGAAGAYHTLKNKKQGTPLIVIVPDGKTSFDNAVSEFKFFASPDLPVLEFPAYTQEPFEEARVLVPVMARRSNALYQASHLKDFILIVSPYSILKKLTSKSDFLSSELVLKTGTTYSRSELEYILDLLGYIQVEFVTGAGEYNIRGGLADIFPIDAEEPVRIEFFDDEIENLFFYNTQTQLKIKPADSIRVLPASDLLLSTDEFAERIKDQTIKERAESFGKFAGYHWYAPLVGYECGTIFDYVPSDTQFVCLSGSWKDDFEACYNNIEDKVGDNKRPYEMLNNFISSADVVKRIRENDAIVISDVSQGIDSVALEYGSTKTKFAFEKKNLYQSLTNSMKVITSLLESGTKVVLAIESDKFSNIFMEFSRDYEITPILIKSASQIKESGVYLYKRRVSGGFTDEKNKLSFVADFDIFGFSKRKPKQKKKEVFNTTLADLEEGDYVVHVNHGIGIYRGIKQLTIGGVEGEFLDILYAGNDILYVPLQAITHLQKYIGLHDQKPALNSLKSSAWAKLKKHARESAKSIAEDLLRLYAERKAKKGFAFSDDGTMVEDFERTFEYDETEDQLSAIIDVYKDMESDTPMERLVCGDVGFGKTEVAMRASCKAVACGKQAAVLVPTTILARQHFETFTRRFANLPISVDFVSRFRSDKEVKEIYAKMASGKLDILIGTHKILSKDLSFKDLGLLIIDEEQRFGVAHKEKIAAIKRNVDTLTLSATPIPRTLQLSLSGIRDMSIIETPPENRLPVVVKVIKEDNDITKAIKYELERGGQVFFLHNKVADIDEVATFVKKLVPFARIDYAHGQMDPKTLEKILQSFYAGDIDVLISTTIIENGIDIPNVNTIVINDVSHFGLSQLYQLKGRVGRSSRRGYCYLFVDNYARLSEIARKRLSIIQQLSDLGSGFKIAMYDLQLRGAGNILGAEQSGFVVRVGYELYVSMIEEAVSEMKGEFSGPQDTEINSNIAYFIPADYIENPRVRFDYYRRFAGICDRESVDELLSELEASFGELKIEVMNLGYVMYLKNLCGRLGVSKANISKTGCKFEFAKGTNIDVSSIAKASSAVKIAYRFVSEYELSVAVSEGDTLGSLITFMEKLLPKEQADNL